MNKEEYVKKIIGVLNGLSLKQANEIMSITQEYIYKKYIPGWEIIDCSRIDGKHIGCYATKASSLGIDNVSIADKTDPVINIANYQFC